MVEIRDILNMAVRAGASDVHVTVGIPPKMRVNGSLVFMPYENMTEEETDGLARSNLKDKQYQLFIEQEIGRAHV